MNGWAMRMEKIGILWDLDGTIADSVDLYYAPYLRVFEKYGLFDERFRLLEDWPKWLEITSIGLKPVYSDFIAAKW